MVPTSPKNREAWKFYDEVYGRAHPLDYAGTQEGAEARNALLLETVAKWMAECGVGPSAAIVEVGCGLGYLHKSHPNWRGLEYSPTAVRRAKEIHGDRIRIEEGDARELPIKTASINFLFSFAALEHVPEVERAFDEIDRVLEDGGCALLSPAWNCRPWTVRKLSIRPYSDLGALEKLQKALIPVRNNIAIRAVGSMPRRLVRELKLLCGQRILIEYKELHPDLSLNARWPHVSDDDAFISMDAHAALTWFKSKGYECLSHPKLLDRIMVRGNEVVVRKPLRRHEGLHSR